MDSAQSSVNERGERRGTGDLTPTRREVLAASGALAVGGAAAVAEPGGQSAPEAGGPVLAAADLVEADAYVEWGVDAVGSPLAGHLERTVDGFDGAGGVARAYVSDGTAGIPRYVESAAFPAADLAAVAEATAAWFASYRGTRPTYDERGEAVAAWHHPAGAGEREAVRVERVADRVLLTVAGGHPAEGWFTGQLGPLAAVGRYGELVAERIGGDG